MKRLFLVTALLALCTPGHADQAPLAATKTRRFDEKLADLPKIPEYNLEMINGLIAVVGSPQEVAFKGDDISTTLARQCIICLDPSDRLLSLMCTLRA